MNETVYEIACSTDIFFMFQIVYISREVDKLLHTINLYTWNLKRHYDIVFTLNNWLHQLHEYAKPKFPDTGIR